AAPSLTGCQSAATTTMATSIAITATSPTMTQAGFANALPWVTVVPTPSAVRSVKLSHDGAKAIAAPSPANAVSTNARALSRLLSLRGHPGRANSTATTEPAAHASHP